MEAARAIARLGFRKWYERRLMEAHAWLLTALLCAIYVETVLGELRFDGNLLVWLGNAGGMFIGGLIVWHGLRRFGAVLVEAERFASQAICATCKAYARFEVLREQPTMTVRCRKCSREWVIG